MRAKIELLLKQQKLTRKDILQPFERRTTHGARPFEVESSSIAHVGLSQQQNPMLQFMPSNSIKQTLRDDTLLSAPEKISTVDSMTSQQEVILKILCLKYQVGAVVGKRGSVVRALESEIGASICVGRALSESDEIMITISAMENVERPYSPAQKGAILVLNRFMEVRVEKGWDFGFKRIAYICSTFGTIESNLLSVRERRSNNFRDEKGNWCWHMDYWWQPSS